MNGCDHATKKEAGVCARVQSGNRKTRASARYRVKSLKSTAYSIFPATRCARNSCSTHGGGVRERKIARPSPAVDGCRCRARRPIGPVSRFSTARFKALPSAWLPASTYTDLCAAIPCIHSEHMLIDDRALQAGASLGVIRGRSARARNVRKKKRKKGQ